MKTSKRINMRFVWIIIRGLRSRLLMELSELDCGGDDCRDSATTMFDGFGGTTGGGAINGTIAEEDGMQSSAHSGGAGAAVGEATGAGGGGAVHAPAAPVLSSSSCILNVGGALGPGNAPQLLHEDLVVVLLDLAREWRSRQWALTFHSPANDAITLELAVLHALLSPRGKEFSVLLSSSKCTFMLFYCDPLSRRGNIRVCNFYWYCTQRSTRLLIQLKLKRLC